MKFRLLLLTAALFTISNLTPVAFGQTGTPGSQPTPGTAPGTPVPSGDPGVSGTAPQNGSGTQGTQSTPVQPADPDKVKHDGGKADVDAIGNRKVGARGVGNWYSI